MMDKMLLDQLQKVYRRDVLLCKIRGELGKLVTDRILDIRTEEYCINKSLKGVIEMIDSLKDEEE